MENRWRTRRRVGAATLVFFLLVEVPIQWPTPARSIEGYLDAAAAAIGVHKARRVAAPGGGINVLPTWYARLAPALSFAITLLPGLWISILAYDRLTYARQLAWTDGRTRCGRCQAVLSGLNALRCPICGETL